jgi:hypothetical protein
MAPVNLLPEVGTTHNDPVPYFCLLRCSFHKKMQMRNIRQKENGKIGISLIDANFISICAFPAFSFF